MTLWWDRFFWNCTNLNPSDHWVVSLWFIHDIIISLMSALALSTEPWFCGCLGLPWTITSSCHSDPSSIIMLAVSSLPLSLWRMWEAPNKSVWKYYSWIAPTLHGKTYPADQPFLQFLPPNLTESQIWPLFERTVHPKSITKINHKWNSPKLYHLKHNCDIFYSISI